MIANTTARRVSVGEVQLEVTVGGAGTPVVLLHGFPSGVCSWRHQITALIDAGFHVIVPEQRGYDHSDKPAGVGNYRLEKLAGDVVGLLDALGIPRAHLVGHDWGGAVAWAVAALHPSRVDRLVVMNGPHPEHARRLILRDPRQTRRSYYMFLFQLPFLPERTLRRDDFIPRALKSASVNKNAFDEETVRTLREAIQRPGAATAMLNWYRAGARYGVPRLPQVLARTLCIWGEGDPALDRRLADTPIEYVRQLEVRRIPGAGHFVAEERPEIVNQILLEFLRR